MYALFEDAGRLHAGRILSETESSAQIELDTGRRAKVKSTAMLLKFAAPAPEQLLAEAAALAAQIELPIAWEFAPDDEFAFAELAREYFSAQATLHEQVAMLLALMDAPHYFRRAGKGGRFKKASAQVLEQALAAIEKKKQVQAQIDVWAHALVVGQCPEPIAQQLYKILFRPDKNAPEYKAVVQASRASAKSPLALLQHAGAIASPWHFHWQRFALEFFPTGPGFGANVPALDFDAQAASDALLVAEGVRAYSIDDALTTEIDDALSLTGLGTGRVRVGIHIAAPALGIAPDSALDKVARTRLSTVYMPGGKITMLPKSAVEQFTLDAPRLNPAVSLYVDYDEATLEVLARETRIERVFVAHNFRTDDVDDIVSEDWLAGRSEDARASADLLAVRDELAFLHRLAVHLKAGREAVRGKPENFSRPDYNFRLHEPQPMVLNLFFEGEEPESAVERDPPPPNWPQGIPLGDEDVEISERRRGAPLDLIVAESAIVANSTWGRMLADAGVPGIYRSQAALSPGIKVRMGAKPLKHAGMGVECYAWSTSPLRRYVDLVNQRQIVACVRHGATAALVAPFKPKDAQLFAVISAFEATYLAYNAWQSSMERFWTLRYLAQNDISELDAAVVREAMPGSALIVRALDLPLVLSITTAQHFPRGAKLRVRVGDIDEIALDAQASVIARLDDPADRSDDVPPALLDDDEDHASAGPLRIDVDVSEDDASETASDPTSAQNGTLSARGLAEQAPSDAGRQV